MVVFRIICALLMAWAMNWALGLPEALTLIEELPEMEQLGVVSGAFVGFFVLAPRQGWGMIVAVANGVWGALVAVMLAGIIYVTYRSAALAGQVSDFDHWGRLAGEEFGPIMDHSLNFPLWLMSIAAGAIVGIVTEAIHWALVRLRKARGDYYEERGTTTIRGNPRDIW